MASRLSRSAAGVARLRPSVSPRTIQPLSAVVQTRHQSNLPSQDPKSRAQSIVDALPGSTPASKFGILSAGAGISIAAISNELYVVNEESIVALCLLTVFYGIAKYGGPMYKDWADGQREKVSGILNGARAEHTNAVKARIDSVKDLGTVVQVTKDLFAVSKETAELEAKAYELEQKTALAAEAKAVLDSWVRYEGQVKQRQQKELAENVIAKIDKELEDPKVLKRILDQSVADVERILAQAK